jgi:Uncharacterized conserved protein
MMKITIHNLGPIKDCVIEPSNFTVLMGEQASGKSTIAKCVFFFSTVKDDICECILKKQRMEPQELVVFLQRKLLGLFGKMLRLRPGMELTCRYAKGVEIRASLVDMLQLSLSQKLIDKLEQNGFTGDKAALQQQLNDFFQDDYGTVFIPASRNIAPQLSIPINYIYASMGEDLRNGLDYATQKFFETIFLCRISLGKMADERPILKMNGQLDASFEKWIQDIEELQKGRYAYVDGEERLYLLGEPLDGGKYIQLYLASSGQQGLVWLMNIATYYMDAFLRTGRRIRFIIEEPEAHLYPAAQKKLMELLAFVANHSQGMFITTHSPYVLGSLNNLLYAANQPSKLKKKVAEIIPEEYQLKHIDAFYLKDGMMESCLDTDGEPLIQNDVIDSISYEINDNIDRIIDLRHSGEK